MTLDTSQPALVHMTLGLPVCPGGQPPVQRLPVRVLMQFAQVAVLPGTIGASAHTAIKITNTNVKLRVMYYY